MTLHSAIFKLNPTVVVIRGDIAYDINGDVVEYDATEVANLIASENYIPLRQNAYPTIGDQLDMLWHMIDKELPFDKTSVFYTTLASVKNQHPK